MSTTALNLTHAAAREFLDRSRNLLALTKEGAHRVMKRLEAALTLLDADAKNDVLMYLDTIDQPGYAGQIGREDFRKSMYACLAKAFLKAQRNCVIEFVTRLTPEALAELEALEVSAGERQPAPPAPPQTSAQELLEEQVREDWRKLPTDKLKSKMNRDPQYRQVFDRLMSVNELDSHCTSLHDGAATI